VSSVIHARRVGAGLIVLFALAKIFVDYQQTGEIMIPTIWTLISLVVAAALLFVTRGRRLSGK
jgi:hypothetical protein